MSMDEKAILEAALKHFGAQAQTMMVFEEMAERDKNDSTRDVAPCVKADDATLLDNSDLTFEQSVAAVLKIIKKKQKILNKKALPFTLP